MTAMPTSMPHTKTSDSTLGAPATGDHLNVLSPLLGTDDLVVQLRAWIPGGLSKRMVYQWLDLGCPHVVLPGQRRKLAFVLEEVMDWVMSHRVEQAVLTPKSRGVA